MAGRNRRNIGRRGGRGKGAGAGVLAALLAVAAVIWVVASARHHECAAPTEIAAESLEKVTVPPGTPEELLRYRGMTVSFNPETHQPNYVDRKSVV